MFAGVVHEIGQFYLLARAAAFPALLQREQELSGLMFSFSRSVGRAVLESLKVPAQIVDAVDDPSIEGPVVPPRTLADVIFLAESMAVRGAISCALGCPYQGEVEPSAVAYVAQLMKDIGVQHIGVADTIGVGTPEKTHRAMEAALAVYDLADVSGHFHDTYGMATANVYACLEMGISSFDASIAGLGGCPYAKGATGNVATEDVLYLLRGLDIDTGIDFEQAVAAGQWISGILQRKAHSRAGNAVTAKLAA